MPPIVVARWRVPLALPLVAAIAFASVSVAAPPARAGAAPIVLLAQPAAPANEPVTLKDHTGWVGGTAFSPDGKTLATASADKTVKLWDTTTWKRTAIYPGASADRVRRGGSFVERAEACKAGVRGRYDPKNRSADQGLRVVLAPAR